MAMLKYFGIPFATSGDKVTVPVDSQPTGSVSYTDGFGPDYELDPAVDPAAKDVPRDETNQLFFDTTNAIKEYQEFGTPDYIDPALNGSVAFSYAQYARVKWTDGAVYESRVGANTSTPADLTKWRKLTENVEFVAIITTAFEASVANGEAVYWDSANSRFDEAVADGTTKQNVVGFADVTNGRVILAGLYAGQLAGLTPGAVYYLSGVTPGAITTVASQYSVVVGIAKSATDMFVGVVNRTSLQVATPAQFNESKQVINSEFLQRALGGIRGASVAVNATGTLVGADVAGKFVQVSGVGPYTIMLPLVNEVTSGSGFGIICTATGTVTIQRQGANQIYSALNNPVNSFTVQSGDTLWIQADGGVWNISAGSKLLEQMPQFTRLLAASGYQKLPGGLIIQWATVTFTTAGTPNTFPIAFPTACLGVTATVRRTGSPNAYLSVGTPTVTGFTGYCSGAGATETATIFAIGN
jgi:hypothetical protein